MFCRKQNDSSKCCFSCTWRKTPFLPNKEMVVPPMTVISPAPAQSNTVIANMAVRGSSLNKWGNVTHSFQLNPNEKKKMNKKPNQSLFDDQNEMESLRTRKKTYLYRLVNALYAVVTGNPIGSPLLNNCKRTNSGGHCSKYRPEKRSNGFSNNFS